MSQSIDPVESRSDSPRTTTWTDSGGTKWDFRLTVSKARRLKGDGIDVLNPDTVKKLFSSPLALIEFVAEMMREEWQHKGMCYEQYADLLTNDEQSFVSMQSAIEYSFADFFRRLGHKHYAVVAERAMESANRIMEQAAAIADQRTQKLANRMEREAIERMNAEFDALEAKPGSLLDSAGE